MSAELKTLSSGVAVVIVLSFGLAHGCSLDSSGTEPSGSGAASGGGAQASSGSGQGTGGGAGGGGACDPGAVVACYEGPPMTEGVGRCEAGQKTCAADGSGFGPCEEQALPEVEDCLKKGDEDCDTAAPACTGDPTWSKRFGGIYDDAAMGVAVDKDQSVIVAGHFRSAAVFGEKAYIAKGDADIFVTKYTPSGDLVWAKVFGGLYLDKAYAVATDADGGVVVAGEFSGTVDFGAGEFESSGGADIFLLKLDAGGALVFAKHFGGLSDQRAKGLAITASGDIVIAGEHNGEMSFDAGAPTLAAAGGGDIFVAGFTKDGGYLFSDVFGEGSPQAALAVAPSPDGGFVVAGEAYGKVDFGGGELATKNKDAFVAAFDASGAYRYASIFGDYSEQSATAVAVDKDGSAIVAGDFQGKIQAAGELSAQGWDVFVLKLDPLGAPAWGRQIGDGDEQRGRGVAVDLFGNVVVAAGVDGAVTVGSSQVMASTRDLFVAKLTPAGDGVWARTFGDGGWEQRGHGVATDPLGYVLLVGEFDGSMTMGDATHATAGGRDGIVAKLAP